MLQIIFMNCASEAMCMISVLLPPNGGNRTGVASSSVLGGRWQGWERYRRGAIKSFSTRSARS